MRDMTKKKKEKESLEITSIPEDHVAAPPEVPPPREAPPKLDDLGLAIALMSDEEKRARWPNSQFCDVCGRRCVRRSPKGGMESFPL